MPIRVVSVSWKRLSNCEEILSSFLQIVLISLLLAREKEGLDEGHHTLENTNLSRYAVDRMYFQVRNRIGSDSGKGFKTPRAID